MKTVAFLCFLLSAFMPTVSGQAAKFAAGWSDGEVTLFDITKSSTSTSASGSVELLAKIKPPGNKDLLIGVSGVINIVTDTTVRASNKNGKDTASAEGTVNVEVRYAVTEDGEVPDDVCSDGDIAAPGQVTFASRRQELSVELDLDICNATGCGEDVTGFNITGFVEIGLLIDTTAAHHFNFVVPTEDLPPIGSESLAVVACYIGEGETIITDADGDSSAGAFVAVHARMVTVQAVQSVNGDLVDGEL